MVRRLQGQMAIREKTGEALAELVTDEIPEALINNEMQQRLQDLAMRLQAQGMGLEQYFAASGSSPEQVQSELREAADQAVKVDLALRAVVIAEGIEVTDEELDEELASVAERVDQPIAKVLQQLTEGGQLSEVRADLAKRNALGWLLEKVEIVDEDGNALERSAFEIEQPAEDGAEPASEGDAEGAVEAGAEGDGSGDADGDEESSAATEASAGSVGSVNDTDPAPKGDEQ